MSELKIGLVGLDTSHAKVFTRIINDPSYEHHMPRAGRVVLGYPGGSPDFPASINRVEGYTRELSESYGVRIAETPEQVAEEADLILLTAVDGRVHRSLFERIVGYRKPVFVDKPFALTSEDARAIVRLGEQHGVPIMTSSVRRFAPELTAAVEDRSNGAVIGAECFGPIEFLPSNPGWFWYGIHTVEVLYAIMGPGCVSVTTTAAGAPESEHELVTGVWADGRIGIARGNRIPNVSHGAFVHREKGTAYVNTASDGAQKYTLLLAEVIEMVRTGRPAVEPSVSVELIRFLEAANESRLTGKTVAL
ncbi:Gfo/Idh/MocA family protein [Paenibacillus sp. HJGM_3]|uniref:Gfo/Idh/MocA family protein n=1 Tax=Paenibacillus sp. HJGM_3 TaxID=3379816 RepID=UPI00385BD4EE